MWNTILVMAVVCQLGNWDGIVTGSAGSASVTRDGQEFRLAKGAGLRVGDRIGTGSDGALSFLLRGRLVYVGRGTQLVLVSTSQGKPQLSCSQGELRIATHAEPLLVRTPHGDTELGAGELRIQLHFSHTIARFNSGSGVVRFGDADAEPVNAGSSPRDFVLSKYGVQPVAFTEVAWAIDPIDYQRLASQSVVQAQFGAAAAESSLPALPPLPTNGNPTPASPAGPTPTGPTTPDGVAGAENNVPSLPPLPDEEPRVRSGQTDANDNGSAARAAQSVAARNTRSTANLLGFNFSSANGLSLGGPSSTSFASASGGLNPDANQQSFQGQLTAPVGALPAGAPFPGSIHLMTSQTAYQFTDIQLTAAEKLTLNVPEFWSIGVGSPATTQVTTDFFSASDIAPTVLAVPHQDAYLLRFDQYGLPDFADDDSAGKANVVGVTGLLGATPTAPDVNGAQPLEDTRGSSGTFNSKATFALGEFRVGLDDQGQLEFAIRRSAQDRLIAKDPNGNDALDQVTVNPDVDATQYRDESDPRFLPQAPVVKVPGPQSFDTGRQSLTSFSKLDATRRAAATTLMADKLYDYARRTGQTRFLLDGKVMDISGYRR